MRLRAVSSDGTQTGGLDSILESHGPGGKRTGSQASLLAPHSGNDSGQGFPHGLSGGISLVRGNRLSSCVQVAGVCYKARPGGTTSLCSCSQLFQCPLPSFSLCIGISHFSRTLALKPCLSCCLGLCTKTRPSPVPGAVVSAGANNASTGLPWCSAVKEASACQQKRRHGFNP